MNNLPPSEIFPAKPQRYWNLEWIPIRIVIILGIAIPITINLLLINAFFYANRETKTHYEMAFHSKEVQVFTRFLNNHVLELANTIKPAFSIEKHLPENESIFLRLLGRFDKKVDALVTLTADNIDAKKKLSIIRLKTSELISLKREESNIEVGTKILNEISNQVKDLAILETELEFIRSQKAKKSIDFEFDLLILSLSLNILYSLLIAFILRHSFFSTLKRIIENLHSAQRGSTLIKPNKLKSELSILENEFYDLYKKLEEQSSENEGFVYCVSHDLRSPLLSIQSFARDLKKSTEDLERELINNKSTVSSSIQNLISESKESLTFILASISKISQIIESVLGLSKAGRIPINIENLDLNIKLQNLLESIEFNIREANGKIILKELPRIRSDRTATNQIFLNLLTNSLKYREPGRNLEIEIGKDQTKSNELYEAIYVKDNGLGIPPNYLERIFLPFEQIKKRGIPGEGLGLSIVKKLLERVGGKIEVTSTVGVGTTFTIYFFVEQSSETK